MIVRLFILLVLSVPALADLAWALPWDNAADTIANSFKGPVAKGFTVTAIVLGGIMYAFLDTSLGKIISAVVLGGGLAMGAVSFLGIF